MTSHSSVERKLPGWIGLCPDVSHADEFYMPEPRLGDKCPYCENELVIYAPPQADDTIRRAGVQVGEV